VLLPIESDAYAAYAEPKVEPRAGVPTPRPDGKKLPPPPPIPTRLPPPPPVPPAPPPVPQSARAGAATITAGGRKG
jgi:hypothetical protein